MAYFAIKKKDFHEATIELSDGISNKTAGRIANSIYLK